MQGAVALTTPKRKAGQPERVARLSVFSAFLNYDNPMFTAFGCALPFPLLSILYNKKIILISYNIKLYNV